MNMKLYVGITDTTWFDNLRHLQPDEVNFWQPGGRSHFRVLQPGELFLFKLRSPHNVIVGGGFFAHNSILPVSYAWRAFGEKNGASTYMELRALIEQRRRTPPTIEDYKIGCIILTQPFFFDHDQWFRPPSDWSPNIETGKKYDTGTETGKKLWDDVQSRLQVRSDISLEQRPDEHKDRYGAETTYRPRLGQGSFRVIVADAYRRRCAVTQERVLPALIAAHIKPYGECGPHAIENGILLRSDIHNLLDAGYVTISSDYHFEVSKRIKEDFDNGEEYKRLHGSRLYLPAKSTDYPSSEFIKWHNDNKFRS